MATKTSKTRVRAKSRTKVKVPKKVRAKKPTKTARAKATRTVGPILSAAPTGASGLTMRGERLVVKLSRDSHPEVFAIDKLSKQVTKLIEDFKGKRKMRDVVEFLRETEKSLGIILTNHLEDALRKYLR